MVHVVLNMYLDVVHVRPKVSVRLLVRLPYRCHFSHINNLWSVRLKALRCPSDFGCLYPIGCLLLDIYKGRGRYISKRLQRKMMLVLDTFCTRIDIYLLFRPTHINMMQLYDISIWHSYTACASYHKSPYLYAIY